MKEKRNGIEIKISSQQFPEKLEKDRIYSAVSISAKQKITLLQIERIYIQKILLNKLVIPRKRETIMSHKTLVSLL